MKKNLFITLCFCFITSLVAACSGQPQNPVETVSQIAEAAVVACDQIGSAAGDGATCTNASNNAVEAIENAEESAQEFVQPAVETGQEVVAVNVENVEALPVVADGIAENVETIVDTVPVSMPSYMGWTLVPGTTRYQNLFPANATSWTFPATQGMEIINWSDLVVTVNGNPYTSGVLVAGDVVVVTTFEKFGGNPRLVVTVPEGAIPTAVVPWP